MKSHKIPLACCALCVLLGGSEGVSAQATGAARKHAVADPNARVLNDLLNAAQAAIDKQDYNAAAQSYQDYLAKNPDDATVHYDLGYVYSALNRPADAKSEYEHAIALDPKMGAAYLNLGLTLLGSDAAAAVEPLAKASQLTPQDARAKWLLGTALERSGKLPAAIEPYQAAVDLDGTISPFHIALGHALALTGRPTQAESEFRAALTSQGSDADRAQAHRGLAAVLIAQKKLPEGAAELALYLESQPNDSKARVEHAAVLVDLDKYDEALAELDRAAATGPEDLGALKLRSDIYWKQKRFADAVPVLQKAAELAPRDADVAARLGEVYLQKKDYPNAVHWLAAAYNMNPKANDLLADLVDAEFESKNYAGALGALDALAQRQELPLASWYVRAVCYDNLGQVAQALDAYQKFVQLNKDENSDMYFISTARVRVLTRELKDKKR